MVKKIILMFLSLLTVTVIGVGAYGLTILNQTTGTLSKTYKGFGNETNVIAENKPMTILLMGVDTGSGSREDPWARNSDTMILVTVNPQTKETTMTSLERDILTNITSDGETVQAKLNSAYAQGGAKLAIKTIQDLLNIHIEDVYKRQGYRSSSGCTSFFNRIQFFWKSFDTVFCFLNDVCSDFINAGICIHQTFCISLNQHRKV